MAETLTFQTCIGIYVTCGPSAECQCLQSGLGDALLFLHKSLNGSG